MRTTQNISKHYKSLATWFYSITTHLPAEAQTLARSLFTQNNYFPRLLHLEFILLKHDKLDGLIHLSLRMICLGMINNIFSKEDIAMTENEFNQHITALEHHVHASLTSAPKAIKVEAELREQLTILEAKLNHPSAYHLETLKIFLEKCADDYTYTFFRYLKSFRNYSYNLAVSELLPQMEAYATQSNDGQPITMEQTKNHAEELVNAWKLRATQLDNKYRIADEDFKTLVFKLSTPSHWVFLHENVKELQSYTKDNERLLAKFPIICRSLRNFLDKHHDHIIKNNISIEEVLKTWKDFTSIFLNEEDKSILEDIYNLLINLHNEASNVEAPRKAINKLKQDLDYKDFDHLAMPIFYYINYLLSTIIADSDRKNWASAITPLGKSILIIYNANFGKHIRSIEKLIEAYHAESPFGQIEQLNALLNAVTKKTYMWELWLDYVPKSFQNFYIKYTQSPCLLDLNTQFASALSKGRVDYVARGTDLYYYLTSMNWCTLRSPTTIINQTVNGHAASIYLELSPENEWRAVLIDTSGDIPSIANVLHVLHQQRQISSILVYTRYYSYIEKDKIRKERGLQSSNHECAAASLHLCSLLRKRSAQGVNVFDELLAEWRRCEPLMNLVCGRDGYKENQRFISYERAICVPVCAAPVYIVKISQSKIILNDWRKLQNTQLADRFFVGNKRNENLDSYLSRHVDVLKEKQKFYVARWWNQVVKLLLTAENLNFLNLFNTTPRSNPLPPVAANQKMQEIVDALHKILISSFNIHNSTLQIVTGREASRICYSAHKNRFSRHRGPLVLLKGNHFHNDGDAFYFEILIDCNEEVDNHFGFVHLTTTQLGELIYQDRLTADLLIDGYDNDNGFLVSGNAHAFNYKSTKIIFQYNFIVDHYKLKEHYAKDLPADQPPFFEIFHIDKPHSYIRYYGYNKTYNSWGPNNQLNKFPLSDLLFLEFKISLPKQFPQMESIERPTKRHGRSRLI